IAFKHIGGSKYMTIKYNYKEEYYNREDDNINCTLAQLGKERKKYENMGLSPGHIPNFTRVSGDKLSALKEQFSSIIDIIISYMDKISLIIPMDNALIDICTKDGIIIHRIGSAAALEQTGYTIGSIINK